MQIKVWVYFDTKKVHAIVLYMCFSKSFKDLSYTDFKISWTKVNLFLIAFAWSFEVPLNVCMCEHACILKEASFRCLPNFSTHLLNIFNNLIRWIFNDCSNESCSKLFREMLQNTSISCVPGTRSSSEASHLLYCKKESECVCIWVCLNGLGSMCFKFMCISYFKRIQVTPLIGICVCRLCQNRLIWLQLLSSVNIHKYICKDFYTVSLLNIGFFWHTGKFQNRITWHEVVLLYFLMTKVSLLLVDSECTCG